MLKEFRKSRKRRKKDKMDQLVNPAAMPSTRPEDDHTEAELAEGVEIEIYAAAMGLTKSEVWSLLRRGELLGRTEKGKLLVFTRPSSTDLSLERLGATSKASREDLDLPPLPNAVTANHSDGSFEYKESPPQGQQYLAVTESKPIHPEIALLLDHLSLAKEENREIIKLTQDALTRVSTMTDTMIKMKDQLIGAKDEQLMSMKEILSLRDGEIRKLKQEREDLEMLARTLAEQK